MKSLKITLLLAVLLSVFVLTVSGTSSNEGEPKTGKSNVEKKEIKITINGKTDKLKKPGQNS